MFWHWLAKEIWKVYFWFLSFPVAGCVKPLTGSFIQYKLTPRKISFRSRDPLIGRYPFVKWIYLSYVDSAHKVPVTRNFNVNMLYVVSLNKLLNKQLCCWGLTLIWYHRNEEQIYKFTNVIPYILLLYHDTDVIRASWCFDLFNSWVGRTATEHQNSVLWPQRVIGGFRSQWASNDIAMTPCVTINVGLLQCEYEWHEKLPGFHHQD